MAPADPRTGTMTERWTARPKTKATRRMTVACLLLVAVVGGCARRQPPVTPPAVTPAPSPDTSASNAGPPSSSTRIEAPVPVAPGALGEESISARPLEDLNRDSPLRPVFYGLDSAELNDAGRAEVAANAQILRMNQTWTITIEGHCDERGTAEYNLALGERRAVAAKAYLVSLGIAPDRIQTVSYGKEFPFDSGHDERAWARNRRAHFVITSK